MTDDISTQLAANLKRLRDSKGLSQQALADLSGVPRPTVAHLESGQANPTLSVVSKLARSLGVTLDGLLASDRVELRLIEPGELRVERRGKTKRTGILPDGVGVGDLVVERIELKPGGGCELAAGAGVVALVVCERGELVLTDGGKQRLVLRPERVALARGDVSCSSSEGAVAYWLAGFAFG